MSIIQGDALHLPLADESIDAVVCDPPYSLSFMSRTWDTYSTPAAFAEWCEAWAREAHRVLKPGGHLLAAGSSRTFHRLACGIEDAGFEMRDAITHHFGQGFPKSLDVGKAIDKAAGATREVIGKSSRHGGGIVGAGSSFEITPTVPNITTPATVAAKQWDGWGTALKPATEFWTVARKPLGERTVAGNVQTWGTGAINVGACRVGTTDNLNGGTYSGRGGDSRGDSMGGGPLANGIGEYVAPAGRWPTNCVFTHTPDCVEVGTRKVKSNVPVTRLTSPTGGYGGDIGRMAAGTTRAAFGAADGLETIPAYECAAGCPVAELDAQSGITTTPTTVTQGLNHNPSSFNVARKVLQTECYGDTGGASRFFPTFRYQAKADSDQRPSYYTHSCTCEAAWPSHVKATDEATMVAARFSSTSTSGNVYTEESQTGTTYTTLTGTSSTTTPPTSHSSTRSRTSASTRDASGEMASGGNHAQSALISSPSPSTIGTSVPRVGHSTADAALATSHGWSKTSVCGGCGAPARREAHSTVKPLELMRWLVRLVTPPSGLVLDMFAGSGTTAEAALLEGFRCIAIERDASYLPLIRHRLNRRLDPVTYLQDTHATDDTLFGDLA